MTTKPMKASRKSQPSEVDPNLTPPEKRHSHVKTWTKNVNIFEKDFIVVPINENCHWFLAIICFPNMNGCQTMDGQSIKIEPRQWKKKNAASAKEKKIEQTIMCDEAELSDKDEAEGDDSELESDDSEDVPTPPTPPAASVPVPQPTLSVENNSKRPPIKQILDDGMEIEFASVSAPPTPPPPPPSPPPPSPRMQVSKKEMNMLKTIQKKFTQKFKKIKKKRKWFIKVATQSLLKVKQGIL